jgi:DNA-binding transcriptional MerR regulator
MPRRRSNRTPRERHSRIGHLTVGQAARLLGVSPSTLRMWEHAGLVQPARSHGRYRLYSPALVGVLKKIKYLRDVQRLNLPGIRGALGKPATSPNTGERIPTNVGPKLKRLRKRAGLRLVEAAAKANISSGFLSSIENSRANPSVATLQRLAAAYNKTVLDFFDVPAKPRRLVRSDERQALQTESGIRIELLSVGARLLESQLFKIPPGTGSGGTYSHEGEEFIFVVTGTIELWLDELDCHVLREGDSFWFESTVGHRWHNPEAEPAVLLWINTPPTF